MTYSPPTLLILKASVARDLRDPSNKVFSTTEVADLIQWGLVEVNRVFPLARVETVDLVLLGDNVVRQYTIESIEVSRVEVWRDGLYSRQVPESGGDSNSGWDLFGNTLTLPSYGSLDDAVDSIKVYGYADRDFPSADGDVLEVDAEAEMGVRLFASMTAYQRLQNDRAQFQQWMALPGNNDISPTQLDGMANTYLAQWNRHRNQMRRLRR